METALKPLEGNPRFSYFGFNVTGNDGYEVCRAPELVIFQL